MSPSQWFPMVRTLFFSLEASRCSVLLGVWSWFWDTWKVEVGSVDSSIKRSHYTNPETNSKRRSVFLAVYIIHAPFGRLSSSNFSLIFRVKTRDVRFREASFLGGCIFAVFLISQLKSWAIDPVKTGSPSCPPKQQKKTITSDKWVINLTKGHINKSSSGYNPSKKRSYNSMSSLEVQRPLKE